LRILSITAGAAGMYCGSCLRDNALAAELLARGHEVTLVPVYTPTLTDEANVSRGQVLFGGINVYLQQRSPLFRRRIPLVDRVLDNPTVISSFASRSVSTDPRLLGDLTLSMLDGTDGLLAREFDKLLAWLADEPAPDVVNLPNSLLIGLARPIAGALRRPVCCTLQGEDLFLNGLLPAYRERAIERIRQQAQDVDRFVAVSDFCARSMSDMLRVPVGRVVTVPLGIRMEGYARHDHAGGDGTAAFTVGYFARVAPEKGLHLLAEAYQRFRRRQPDARAKLDAAGYLAPADKPYLDGIRQSLERAGLGHEFAYHGAVDLAGKRTFLAGLDVFSMPATYDEPKGISLLEAMASGVPVVQPRRGAFVEVVERTGGGLLVDPDDPESLASGLEALYRDPRLRARLGQQAFEQVRAAYTLQQSADRLTAVYEELARRPG
jgi:glycosyltransferase involved in cell wall biosynthesis